MAAISANIGLMAYLVLYYRRLNAEDRKLLMIWIQPLFIRSSLALFIAFAFLIGSNYGIYSLFGTYRHDPRYTEKIVNAYENPDDTAIVNDYKRYDMLLRTPPADTVEAN